MMSIPRRGIIVPLITPFAQDEEVNYDGVRRNVEHLMDKSVQGMIVLPTAGEAPSLLFDERRQLIDTVAEVLDGRKPLLVGVGGINVRETERLIRVAEEAGAAGIFVISPYFYKFTSREYLTYYRRIAESTDLEILAYNSTYAGMPLTLEMIEELADIPNIVALKEGNQLQLGDAVRRVGDRMSIFTSRDLYIFETLSLGGHGAIAFAANVVPDLTIALFKAYEAGDIDRARKIQFQLNPLILKLVMRSYPAPLKAAMNLIGLVGGHVRSPLTDLNLEEVEGLRAALAELELVPN